VRSLIPLAIIAALLLLDCVDTTISPIESDNYSNHLIELQPKAGLKNSFSGDVDITMTANDSYAADMSTPHMEEINYNQKFNIEG